MTEIESKIFFIYPRNRVPRDERDFANVNINSQVLKSARVCVTLDLTFLSLDICYKVQWNGFYFSIYGHLRF